MGQTALIKLCKVIALKVPNQANSNSQDSWSDQVTAGIDSKESLLLFIVGQSLYPLPAELV